MFKQAWTYFSKILTSDFKFNHLDFTTVLSKFLYAKIDPLRLENLQIWTLKVLYQVLFIYIIRMVATVARNRFHYSEG